MPTFSRAQRAYACHHIACFPLDPDSKKPSIRAPDRLGLRGSGLLTSKFPLAGALGFWAGPRNGITVMDVDETGHKGERILEALQGPHGASRFIVRTASGKFHAYYRNDHEPRLIRLYGQEGPAVDVLGSGVVVAPPSRFKTGSYEIVHGKMDDLDRLTKLHGLDLSTVASTGESSAVKDGSRNSALFRYCLKVAPYCDDVESLIDEARTFADDMMARPLPDPEIVKTARSAWGYEDRGENWVRAKTRVSYRIDLLKENLDAFGLYSFIRHHNSGRDAFVVANAIHKELGWTLRRLQSARAFLIEAGHIVEVTSASSSSPAVYGWGTREGHKDGGRVF